MCIKYIKYSIFFFKLFIFCECMCVRAGVYTHTHTHNSTCKQVRERMEVGTLLPLCGSEWWNSRSPGLAPGAVSEPCLCPPVVLDHEIPKKEIIGIIYFNIWLLHPGTERGCIILYGEWKVRRLAKRDLVASMEYCQTNRSWRRTFMASINNLSLRHHYQLIFSFLRTSCSRVPRNRARHSWDSAGAWHRGRFLCSNVAVRRKPAVCSTAIQCLFYDTLPFLF